MPERVTKVRFRKINNDHEAEVMTYGNVNGGNFRGYLNEIDEYIDWCEHTCEPGTWQRFGSMFVFSNQADCYAFLLRWT